jgi:hypothetical protein
MVIDYVALKQKELEAAEECARRGRATQTSVRCEHVDEA